MQADGLILAGGKSTRMNGFHKGNLRYDGNTFVERLICEMKRKVQNIWISYGTEIQKEYPGCHIVQDVYPDCGPISGLHAGLSQSQNDLVCVAACDMPFLKVELYHFLFEQMQEEDMGVVPVTNGKIHPLAAIYKKELRLIAEEQIQSGNYKVIKLLERVKIRYVDVSNRPEFCEMLQNVNTIEQYQKINELTLAQATEILLEKVEVIKDTEQIFLWDAVGRVLAEDITAERNQPPFPRSPLDGYAVRSEDIKEASPEKPVTLQVIDEVMAGYVSHKEVTSGTAVRIMTGAPIPDGADCIIRQEDTDYGEDTVEIYQSVKGYQNYCFEGEDYKIGDKLLSKDIELGAVEIGTLASLGYEEVKVYRKAKAALFTTGDEIVLPGEELKEGKIYDSNLYTLGTRLLSWGVEVPVKERVCDDAACVAERIKAVCDEVDIIVTTGGVSVGKKDIMHEVLTHLGAEKIFWKIAIKPGMPTLCASYRGKLLICLSGNPFGATVNLDLLVRPLLAKMTQKISMNLVRKQAVTENAFPKVSPVTRYVRAFYDGANVRMPEGSNASGILSSMCGCNCLIEIPAGTERICEGDQVWIVML